MDLHIKEKKPVDGYYIFATAEITEDLPHIIELDIPLRRKRKDGTYAYIPPKDFNTYLKNKEMTFYIDEGSYRKLISGKSDPARRTTSTTTTAPAAAPQQKLRTQETAQEPVEDKAFHLEISQAQEMDITERVQSIMNSNYRMNGMIDEERRFDPGTIDEVSGIFSKALCINKVTMAENLKAGIPQDNLHQIISGSHTLIDNLLRLMAKGKASFGDLARLEYIQTGSNTLNHMNRLLIRFIAFLFFYNSYFQKHSNDIKKFRAHFKETFFPYYDKLFHGSQQINLEIVFKNGISPVQERARFIDYAVGGFMHDIGKLPGISYHDGSEGFDPVKARRHVFDSFNMLLEAKEFSMGAVATGLLHHDYYNSTFGYRQLETFKTKFSERREKQRETSPLKHVISYSINDVGHGNSLAYFPCKVLEILDVYDAMTDPGKKYRSKAMTPEEAVAVIRTEYLNGSNLGMDPILFVIFIDFLRASGDIVDPDAAESLKIFC